MIREFLFWLVWNIPLGKLAPWIFGIAVGSKPVKVNTKQETVECQTCKDAIEIENAHEVLESTFVCNPDLQPGCLWQFNNENYVRSGFHD